MRPVFLTLDEVLQIHEDMLNRYGGDHGIRDIDLLISAIAQPQATFEDNFLHKDLYAMAAVYLFHIVKNHPFIDGNKRVGATTALVFLHLNAVCPMLAPDELENIVMRVASGKMDKTSLIESLRAP